MENLHPIDGKLLTLGENAGPQDRLDAVWCHYELMTNTKIERPPTPLQRSAVHSWLLGLRCNGDDPVYAFRITRVRHLIFLSLVEKAMTLQQTRCNACEIMIDENGKFPLHVNFPIQVEPWSAQSNENRTKIRKAVNDELRRAGISTPWDKSPICVTVISLVPRQSQTKDVDNLAKGLLDDRDLSRSRRSDHWKPIRPGTWPKRS